MPRPTEEELQRAYDYGRSEAFEESRKEIDKPWLVGWLWDEVNGFFVGMFKNVWGGFIDMMAPASYEVIKTFNGWFNGISENAITKGQEFLSQWGIIDKDDIKAFEWFKKLPFPINIITFQLLFMVLAAGYITTMSSALWGTIRQSYNKVYSPEVPSPRDVMQAAFVAPEKTAEVRDAMKRAGLSDNDIDLFFLSAYRLYNEDVVRILWLRGVLTDDQMYMRMRELGYTDTRTKEIIQGWPIIPGPSDLFHLVAREAFEPDAIELMGLGDEFPQAQVEWLQKQGISEEWAKKYWYAHWDQPSIQAGYEMLHREVIGLEALNMLFKTVEIPPFWRDKLIKIAYQPYTRVDVRRMHDMGVLDDEALIKSYKDLGYDEEHALKMAQFTVRYNRQGDKELSMSQVLKGYKENLIDKEDAKDLLIQLEYTEAQADYFIVFEDYKEAKEYQDDIITNIKERYQNNLIDDFDAQSRLNALNLPAKQVSLLMDRWQIQRFEDRKLPSKTDLDKFLKNKIINKDIYRLEMHKLGYPTGYITWYEKLIDLKKAG